MAVLVKYFCTKNKDKISKDTVTKHPRNPTYCIHLPLIAILKPMYHNRKITIHCLFLKKSIYLN